MRKDPLRVLHVVTYMGRGGLETMIMNYYRHIDRNVVQFDFLVHRQFKADYDDEIRALGGVIYHLPRLNPFSAKYRAALNKFFGGNPKRNIVHVHQDCMSAIALAAAAKNGVPVRIAHAHTPSQTKNIKYPIKLFYKRKIAKEANCLMACSREAGEWMFNTQNCILIRNAIDTRRFCFEAAAREKMRKHLRINQSNFVVGHVGGLREVKNHDYLLEVFAVLKKKHPDSVLLLVGDGERRKHIEERIDVLGLRKSVILAGNRKDVPELMHAMDCFVFPSLYEGMSLAVIEAQCTGLPCLLSDAIPDECIVTELCTKISLKESPEKWAEAILSTRGKERIDHSRRIIEAGCDISTNAQRLQEFYVDRLRMEK